MKRFKIVSILFLTLMAVVLAPSDENVKASVAYDSYSYNYWENPVPSPHPYTPTAEMTGSELGIGDLDGPSDMFLSESGHIYIVDTNNNRVVWFDQEFNLVNEITTFNNGDTFNLPQGIYVTEEGSLYVADTQNYRIVKFDTKGEYEQTIEPPVTDLISDTTSFRPTKIVVDGAERIYALAIGINSGIVEINPDGSFQGFMGATEVSITPLEYVWRRFLATDEQRQRMGLILPTEYSNIYLDNEEFLYVTREGVSQSDYGTDVIRRLNPMGVSVLREFGYGPPIGDYFTGGSTNISRFNDITVTDYQVYTALDSNTGKLFAYDYDGHLLYVFGENGNRFGNFRNAVAVEHFDDQMYVLDSSKNSLTKFNMTDYGMALHTAISMHYDGHYEEVEQQWQEVLKYNANADIAYIGLGKAQLRNGEYSDAMNNFKLAHDRDNFSKAFTRYRRQFLIEYFGIIMTAILILVGLIIVISLVRKERKRGLADESVL